VDLLQLLILLTITGICGAFAVLIIGFSPRGVVIQLFALIAGTIGAALGGLLKERLGIPDLFSTLKIGTVKIDIIITVLGSLVVVGLLLGLQILFGRVDQRAARQANPASGTNGANGSGSLN
jgi:hypothetical protein